MIRYTPEIIVAATKHGLDADLVTALVEQESAGLFHAYRYEPGFWKQYLAKNPHYNGRYPEEVAASFGLMQVMFPTAVEYGFPGEPWDLFSPTKNLDIGCTILAALLKWAGGLYRGLQTGRQAAVTRKALAAYNGGKGGSSHEGPQHYATQVLERWERLRQSHADL